MSLHKLLKSNKISYVLGFLFSAFAVSILLYDMILFDKMSLMSDSLDRGYVLAFGFISDWLNGGIQIWNRYNQFPNIFTHLQTGYYDLHKFVTALYFNIFGFEGFAGEAFRMPFVRLYIGFTIFVKSLGLYLLLRRFTGSKLVLVLGIVFANLFLSTNQYVNFTTNNFLSFYPLALHFVLRLFETRKVSMLYWFLIVGSMMFCFNPYHSLNYMYLSLHFFIIGCLGYFFLYSESGSTYRDNIKNWFNSEAKELVSNFKTFGFVKKENLGVLLKDSFSVFISFTVAWIIYGLFKGYPLTSGYIPNSWLSVTPGIILLNFIVLTLTGNYSRSFKNGTLNGFIKILLSSWIACLFINVTPFFKVVFEKTLFIGFIFQTALFYINRYPGLVNVKEPFSGIWGFLKVILSWAFKGIKDFKNENLNRKNVMILSLVLVICFLLVLPNLYIIKNILPTLDYDKSRAMSISPIHYFHKKGFWFSRGGIGKFPFKSINPFPTGVWWATFLFIGIGTIFLSFMGLIRSKDKRKYIFLFSYGAAVFLNWNIFKLLNPLHYINAFTNPLSFTNRSYHFGPTAIGLVFIAPLIVFGLNELFNYAKEKHEAGEISSIIKKFLYFIAFLLVVPLVYVGDFTDTKEILNFYLYVVFGSLIMLSILSVLKLKKVYLLSSLIILFMCFDGFFLAHYIKNMIDTDRIYQKPVFFERKISFDSLKPNTLPLKEHFYNRKISDFMPNVGTNQDGNLGIYYSFTDLTRYLGEKTVYFARHKAYSNIEKSKLYEKYFKKTNELFLTVDKVVLGNEKTLNEVVDKDLLSKLAVIEDGDGVDFCPSVNECEIDKTTYDKKNLREVLRLDLNKASQVLNSSKEFNIYRIKTDFPKFVSSSIVTKDREQFRVKLGDEILYPGQGDLIEPYRFDVNNIELGYR